jgi:hypothetical protein
MNDLLSKGIDIIGDITTAKYATNAAEANAAAAKANAAAAAAASKPISDGTFNLQGTGGIVLVGGIAAAAALLFFILRR